ncbi:hypothetical protein D3C73_966170 [compost metagenome]
MHQVELEYLFNGEPRSQVFEFEQGQLTLRDAAMHLLQLHFGDGENSLVMPSPDATTEQVLEQAELLGLSRIRIVGETNPAG